MKLKSNALMTASLTGVLQPPYTTDVFPLSWNSCGTRLTFGVTYMMQ
ncbi:hypothetical protein [Asticcacaulis benevestitus]|uniref:Uncharacterized protein n=1 Tax=Asticcacaulis benevestitus DSM 16100 = ATCC BAA-896 TaxID=1121022 RepID=V4Q4A7_9CAUL|nr:hypothetical protein [Asticcacaulis benevestitus]ESQ92645.1 hypothetical protein ABENE_07445 [Asticcacaulis benevestitus DSM 16100 = ATCC BAA-896]